MQKINDKIGNTNICYQIPDSFKIGQAYSLEMVLTGKNGETLQAKVNLPKGWSELDLKEIVINSLFHLNHDCVNIEVMFKTSELN